MVPKRTIRAIFNENHYWSRTQGPNFDLVQVVERLGPASPYFGEPFGTTTQIVSYFTIDGEFVATIHQYRRPDGTLGGSGQPDPKVLVHLGIVYRADPEDPEP